MLLPSKIQPEGAKLKKMKISFSFDPKEEKRIPVQYQEYEHDDFLLEQIREQRKKIRQEKLLFIRVEDPQELKALHQVQELEKKTLYLYFKTLTNEILLLKYSNPHR